MKNKLSKYIYAALLTLCAAMPVTAQQRQDAMYIFRNDGVFNAFFFDDIERIDFSMVDTLGALHDNLCTGGVHLHIRRCGTIDAVGVHIYRVVDVHGVVRIDIMGD